METVIITENLTKFYGKARGIENVNLEIQKGEIFGFIGPNGAGKSTTIKCIMNLINKNSGNIWLQEKEVKIGSDKLKEEIGYLLAEVHLYEDLTVEKMIEYSSSFYRKDCKKRAEQLIKQLELDKKKKIDELSLGNLKKVGIVLAMMHEPKILILDEATSGLDPLMQEKFYQLLQEEKRKGTTIFFSSHALGEIKRICDRVGIIKEGKIIKISKVEELTDTNFTHVTILSKQIEEIIEKINCKEIKKDKGGISFIYEQSSNELITLLSQYSIDKLLIEEPTIEEIFMHYYQ